jgi:hypothetical protein
MFSARFPADMMREWDAAADAAGESAALYDKCARALAAAKRADVSAYSRLFGADTAVRAAGTLAAMRYGSPDDARLALAYGTDTSGAALNPVAAVVACMLDETPLLASNPPRLVDREAIMAVPELAPIARAVQVLFCYGPAPRGGFPREATLADVASAAELGVDP